jgi:hypothetical protein
MESIQVLINSINKAPNFEALKGQLVVALTQVYENGGGGGGITGITSTDGSITIDNTDPSVPDLSVSLPIQFELGSNPDTGTGFLAESVGANEDDFLKIGWSDSSNLIIGRFSADYEQQSSIEFSAPGGGVALSCLGESTSSSLSLNGTSASLNAGSNSIRITSTEFGLFDKGESPSTQAAAIADATNTTDVITQLNTLLAAMRAYGLIAE